MPVQVAGEQFGVGAQEVELPRHHDVFGHLAEQVVAQAVAQSSLRGAVDYHFRAATLPWVPEAVNDVPGSRRGGGVCLMLDFAERHARVPPFTRQAPEPT